MCWVEELGEQRRSVLQNLERQIVQSAAVTAEERRVSKNK
jgi:hypothetical protein